MIEPHGGRLINHLVSGEKAVALEAEARELPVIQLNPIEVSDLEMPAIGTFSPPEGFMGRADYVRVIEDKLLANSLPWTLPVTLAVTEDMAKTLENSSRVVLADSNGTRLAILEIQDAFPCGHGKKFRVMLSGTQVRAVLRESGQLPPEFTRPEVAAVLHKAFGQQQMGQGA